MTKQEEINAKKESASNDLKTLQAKRDQLSGEQVNLISTAGGITALNDSQFTEYQNRAAELNKTVDKIEGVKGIMKSADQQQDELNAELKTSNPLLAGNQGGAYFGGLGSLLADSKGYKSFAGNPMAKDGEGFSARFDNFDPRKNLSGFGNTNGFRAANDLLTSNVATWPMLTAPIVPQPIWPPKFQDYLPKIEATTSPIKFRQETAYDNNAAARAEGSPLAQSDFTTSPVTESPAVNGTYYKFSEELIADAPYMRSWLDTQGLLRMMVAFEESLLTGNGTSSALTGFYNRSLPNYSRLANPDSQGNQQTNVDALVQGVDTCRVNGVCDPSLVLIHTTNYRNIRLLKTTFEQYIYGPPDAANDIRVLGVPIYATPHATLNKALTGDFNLYSALCFFPNMPLTMDVSRVGNDRINLEWTLVIYLRAALLLYRTLAFSTISDLT